MTIQVAISLIVAGFCALLVELSRERPGSRPATWFGFTALVVALAAMLVMAIVETMEGFKPRYSRFVARQPQVSMANAANAGVVLIAARVVWGQQDGSFLRPPLVLEDDSGARLYLGIDEEGTAGKGEPLLGDQTNGILYRAGEAAIFVGSVVFVGHLGAPLPSRSYRDLRNERADFFVAQLDWLAFRGATREEVVKALQRREMSRVPIIVVMLLLVASSMLSLVAFVSH